MQPSREAKMAKLVGLGLYVLFVLAAVGTFWYIVWHFVSKFW